MFGMRVADPLRRNARGEIVHRLVGEHADGGIDQRGIDIAALAGALAPLQRRQDADHRIDAGEDVRHRHAGAGRLAVRRAGQRHEAADALRHQIVAGARRIRPGLAEAGDRAIDQARAGRREARIVEAEFLQAADLEVLDQDVRLRRELAHDALAVLALEVAFDRALAAIGRMEIGGAEMAVLALDEGRPPGARVVAGLRALDLDDVGAEIGQHLACPRPGQNAGQFQHANTSQRTRHGQLPLDECAAKWAANAALCGLRYAFCL